MGYEYSREKYGALTYLNVNCFEGIIAMVGIEVIQEIINKDTTAINIITQSPMLETKWLILANLFAISLLSLIVSTLLIALTWLIVS